MQRVKNYRCKLGNNLPLSSKNELSVLHLFKELWPYTAAVQQRTPTRTTQRSIELLRCSTTRFEKNMLLNSNVETFAKYQLYTAWWNE